MQFCSVPRVLYVSWPRVLVFPTEVLRSFRIYLLHETEITALKMCSVPMVAREDGAVELHLEGAV
jgi:hypothetical protein